MMRFIHVLLIGTLSLSALPSTVLASEITGHTVSKTTTHHRTASDSEREKSESVNINSADAKRISSVLKGIGMKRAELIVEYRNKHGLFKEIDDLSKIKGISKKIIKNNQGRIII